MTPDILANKQEFNNFKSCFSQHANRMFILLNRIDSSISLQQRQSTSSEEFTQFSSEYNTIADSIRSNISKNPGSLILTIDKISDSLDELYRAMNIPLDVDEHWQKSHGISSRSVSGTLNGPHRLNNYNLPKGFQWIQISEINPRDLIDGYNAQKMRTILSEGWIKKMEEVVLPALHADPTRNKQFFQRIDQSKGLNYPDGFQKIFERFFGDEHIVLSKIPGTGNYCVINGIHRIAAAKQSGWNAIPAKIL